MSQVKTATRFVQHMISLVQKEMKIDQSETEKLLSGPAEALQSKGVAILNLKVTDFKAGVGGSINLVLEPISKTRRQARIPQHKLKVGDMVALKEYDLYYEKSSLFWTGIIVGVSPSRILLCLGDNEDSATLASLPKMIERCQIVKLPNDVSHQRILDSLTNLNGRLKNKTVPVLPKILLGLQPLSKRKDTTDREIQDVSLNEYQKEAVRFVLGAPEISLIHGPPGKYRHKLTGKTHTLIEIIRQLVKEKKKVLVCGPSNISVDNLVERYIKHDKKVVRIGHPARVSPVIVSYTLDVLCSGGDLNKISKTIQDELRKLSVKLRSSSKVSEKKEEEKILKKIKSLFKHKVTRAKINEKINSANVVFSTLNGSGNANMRNRVFDVVIIDEAGQATEPDCWVALNKAKKAILSGDHLQLPPTVKTPPSIKNISSPLKFQGMSLMNDLTYTLFDRMLSMHGNGIKKLLSIQYRMHENIMKFSSEMLYKNKLIADTSVASHILRDLPRVGNTPETRVPIIMIDTSDTKMHHESKGGKMDRQSTANNYEVKVIISYIRKLLCDGVKKDQIAIITPYKAQVTKLHLAMGEKWVDIEVGTVDGFQGREKEAILLSLVRSNKRGEVGFLAEKRRLNVAMTRARRQLIVVGDALTLNSLKGIRDNRNPFFIDRTFLENWMKWLRENAEVRTSKSSLKF